MEAVRLDVIVGDIVPDREAVPVVEGVLVLDGVFDGVFVWVWVFEGVVVPEIVLEGVVEEVIV